MLQWFRQSHHCERQHGQCMLCWLNGQMKQQINKDMKQHDNKITVETNFSNSSWRKLMPCMLTSYLRNLYTNLDIIFNKLCNIISKNICSINYVLQGCNLDCKAPRRLSKVRLCWDYTDLFPLTQRLTDQLCETGFNSMTFSSILNAGCVQIQTFGSNVQTEKTNLDTDVVVF